MPEIEVTEELMEEVNKLVELDEDELCKILGSQISILENPTDLDFRERLSKTELIERGEIFFGECRQSLKKKICNEWRYCENREKYTDSAALIRDLISVVSAGLGFAGVAVGVSAVVSVLIYKHKPDKFCECD